MLDKKTIKVQKKYDRFSRFYDSLEGGIENKLFSNWRKKLIGNIMGEILEIGVGTGKNLEYYNKNANVIGIDLSSKMLEKAKKKLKILKNKNIKLMEMDALKLRFKNNSFDYIINTFVLCSVPFPVNVIREMKRVLKKDGKILMLEHTKSDHIILKMFQEIHNPITKALFGFNVNRNTIENIKKAGFKPKYKNIAFFDVFKKIEVKNKRDGK
ncbi:class I SAM-dependent methyltransferase [Candidatus Pacearchaeota archaeon]|nr:class I SAM-dependent methyltransferase [Candidatus Pacearchaeota archaeon]